ncbi:hypothetical protein T36_2063 [Helicobacter cinaedi]|uniref:hypothetical protein n=1 Tax=Helicobacter cinaedi TaxID=213 RepID=UPI001F2EABE5|nr:hypothetical protein [Helicobacter cinaedi]BDB65584.1 hypothetical protein T36_2063 [Helicobacter cinaedi]
MKFYIIAITISTAMLFGGCMTHSTLKKRTASVIGCQPQNITIKNSNLDFMGGQHYTALCNGQTFSCTAQEGSTTQCAPMR